jgi:uncharacterized protein
VTSPLRLLELQNLDTTLTQLHHRRGHLPEHTRTIEADQTIAKITSDTAVTRAAHTDLSKKMQALETQVHDLDVRIEHLNSQMFGDASRSPRDLQAIEADIASVKKHRSELEDAELTLIESFEPLDVVISKADAEIDGLQKEKTELAGAIIRAQSEIDAAAAGHIVERSAIAATIDEADMKLYDTIRKNNKGIAVAKLEHGTCTSCRLKLPAVELDRIKHLTGTEMVRCDECSAILVY